MGPAGVSYERARRLLRTQRGGLAYRLLSAVEAALWLLLLVLLGLTLALLTTRGVTEVRDPSGPGLPAWVRARVPAGAAGAVRIPNTGLGPVVVEKTRPGTAWPHRIPARLLGGIVARVRPLQANLSAWALLLSAAMAALLLAVGAGELRRRRGLDAAAGAASALRHQVHRQIYRLGQSALPNEGIGPVLNLFTREVNDVRDALIADLHLAWLGPILAAGLIVTALVLSWPLTLFLASLLTFCALMAVPLMSGARDEAAAAARDAALNLFLLQEDLGIVRTVRVYGMEAIDKDRFESHLSGFERADRRRLRSERGYHPAFQLLAGTALIAGLGLIGLSVVGSPDRPTSLAAALTVVLALGALAWLLYRAWRLAGVLRQAERSAATLFEYLDRRPELLMAPGAQFLPPMSRRIVYEDVTLEDPHGRPVLSGVSTEIPAGGRVAVLGLDEEAKQAFACLIPRLIDPKHGRVRIDNIDLRDVTLESLRAQVSTVFQADLVLSDTVFANIGLGDTSYGLPRVVEAAKAAHVHQVIQDLPDGYDTLIGPLGHYLSPDEQYRIALARAWLHDPSIVIIEEPSATLPEEVKLLIDDSIDRLSRGRTVVFLPHRLSTIRRCDRVIVLHNGRIEDQGTPRELAGRSKLYRHIQYVEFNPFAAGGIEAGQMEG